MKSKIMHKFNKLQEKLDELQNIEDKCKLIHELVIDVENYVDEYITPTDEFKNFIIVNKNICDLHIKRHEEYMLYLEKEQIKINRDESIDKIL